MSATPPASGKVTLFAKLIAKEGKAEELAEILKTLRESSLSDKEPQTHEYRLNRFENEFSLFELYDSAEAISFHMSLSPFQTLLGKKDELTTLVDIKYYTPF